MKKITSIFALILILAACSSDHSNRTVKQFFSAFLNDNSSIVFFGNAELNTILNKTDFSNQPKVGAFLKSPIAMLRNSLNLDTPVFYAVEGPMSDNGPEAIYVFIDIKNPDSLRTNLTKNGFDLLKKGDMDYLQDGDMSLGLVNKLAIVVIKGGDYKGESLLASAFEKANGDESEGRIVSLLDSKGDISMSMNMTNLYGTSKTDLNNLSKEKQSELKTMLANSFVENQIYFENGEIIFESKNHFSKELASKMFLSANPNAGIVAKLGQGTPRFGFSMNLDVKKAQQFVDEFSPELMGSLSEDLGGPFTLAMMASGNDISKILNGQFGIVMVGEPGANGSMIPDFNFFLGLGSKGKSLGEMGKGMLEQQFAQVQLTDQGLSGASSLQFVASGSSKLNLPLGAQNFGKKPITAFVNLEGMDMSGFDLEGAGKLIELIKYATFEYDQNGGKLVLKAKDGKENALKQAMAKIIFELEGEIANLKF